MIRVMARPHDKNLFTRDIPSASENALQVPCAFHLPCAPGEGSERRIFNASYVLLYHY